MKCMGIDYGSKRIGIAVSDDNGKLAFPLSIFPNDNNILKRMVDFVKEKSINTIVIGQSVSKEGNNNSIMEKIIPFKKFLEDETKLPVFFEKEFFTSVEARRTQGGGSGIDASAAALILQRFLDRENKKENDSSDTLYEEDVLI